MNNPTPKIQQFLALAVAIGLATYLIIEEQGRADRSVERNQTNAASASSNTEIHSESTEVHDSSENLARDNAADVHVDEGNDLQPSNILNLPTIHATPEQLATGSFPISREEVYLHSSKVLTVRPPQQPSPEETFLFSSKSMVMPVEEVDPVLPQPAETNDFTSWTTEDLQTRRLELQEELRRIHEALQVR